jgi:Ca2+-binding RTX toxin-like protein
MDVRRIVLLLGIGTLGWAGQAVAEQGSAAAATPTCHGRPATIVGTVTDDTLLGTPGPDVIVALAGNDVIRAGGGDDVVCAGAGSDQIWGETGNDLVDGQLDEYYSDPRAGESVVGDILRPGPGDDQVIPGDDERAAHDVLDEISYDESATGVDVNLLQGTATGEGNDTIAPGPVAVTGSSYEDDIIGGEGDDQIDGGPGADRLLGGAGNDRLEDGDDPGNLARGSTDRLQGGPGDDVVWANGGSDVLYGGLGSDWLADSGHSPDQLYAGPGDDAVDDLWVGSADQVVDGGPGADFGNWQSWFVRDGKRVFPSVVTDMKLGRTSLPAYRLSFVTTSFEREFTRSLRWTFWGTDGPDRVSSYRAPAELHGRGGNDVLLGSPGNDLIYGGPGWDRADGRRGTDTCVSIEKARNCERHR